MAASYGFDIGPPASNAKEAIQWLYFAYLGAVKEQDHLQVTLMNSTTTHDSKVTSSSLFGSVMSPPHAPSQSSSQNSSAFMSAQARHEAQGRGQPERLVHEY